MDNIQSHFVEKVLGGATPHARECGQAFAPSNIALCKYWGKRDAALNLPVNSSLSISLGTLGTRTEVARCEREDRVVLNGVVQSPDSGFALRIGRFLDLFRPWLGYPFFEVRTENNIPTAAGLASSASGFAALVLALDDMAGWGLGRKELSMLARLGSGSASRSIFDGFVQWHAGVQTDGLDSFAERMDEVWPELRIGVLELSSSEKAVGSRSGMNRTVETSALYGSWPAQALRDFSTIRLAIENHDFAQLGKTAECNALAMHATMMAAWPPLIYFQPESLAQIQRIHRLRADGLEIYFTMDAGPNIKLLFLEQSESEVVDLFPMVKAIRPFG